MRELFPGYLKIYSNKDCPFIKALDHSYSELNDYKWTPLFTSNCSNVRFIYLNKNNLNILELWQELTGPEEFDGVIEVINISKSESYLNGFNKKNFGTYSFEANGSYNEKLTIHCKINKLQLKK